MKRALELFSILPPNLQYQSDCKETLDKLTLKDSLKTPEHDSSSVKVMRNEKGLRYSPIVKEVKEAQCAVLC